MDERETAKEALDFIMNDKRGRWFISYLLDQNGAFAPVYAEGINLAYYEGRRDAVFVFVEKAFFVETAFVEETRWCLLFTFYPVFARSSIRHTFTLTSPDISLGRRVSRSFSRDRI